MLKSALLAGAVALALSSPVFAQDCQTIEEAAQAAKDLGGEIVSGFQFDGVEADTALFFIVGDALQYALFKDNCYVSGAFPMAQVNRAPAGPSGPLKSPKEEVGS